MSERKGGSPARQVQLDAAVASERARGNGYLDAVPVILVVLDPNHRVTFINRRGCEFLGCAPNALMGADWFESVLASEQREGAVSRFLDWLAQRPHRPSSDEYEVRAGDGRLRLITWQSTVVELPDGSVAGILCCGADVTDSRRSTEAAREARERMMHVSRLATLSEVAAGISHEINQPLAAITTYAQAARRLLAAPQEHVEDVSEALDQIALQALRAGEIIRRLRNLVRNREIHREPIQINELIEELGALTRSDARAQHVRVTLQLADALPAIELDPVRIQQVLLNLVRNSVEALESDEVTERKIVISTAFGDDDTIEVTVRDTGPGLSAHMLANLYLPFATTKAGGTGLGLAISRGIVEAHGGRLRYTPNAPRGACFIMVLPTKDEEGAAV